MTRERLVTPRATAVVVLLVLALLVVLALSADAASRSTTVIRWLRARQLARFEAGRATYSDTGVYESFEERLLNDELPSMTPGAPVLCLLGASNVSHSVLGGILGDELPPDIAPRLHNVSLGGCSATMLERIVTTLDREKGALRPGSTFVVGLWWGMLSDGLTEAEARFLRYPAERWGLWAWGPEALEPAGGALRPLKVELARLQALRLALQERVAFHGEELPPRPVFAPERLARELEIVRPIFRRFRIPGPQSEALERTLRAIQAKGARLAIVEMPAPTWYRSVPEAAAWRVWIASLAVRLGVQRLDLEDALPDEEFYGEYNCHPLIEGRRRLQPRLVELIRALERG